MIKMYFYWITCFFLNLQLYSYLFYKNWYSEITGDKLTYHRYARCILELYLLPHEVEFPTLFKIKSNIDYFYYWSIKRPIINSTHHFRFRLRVAGIPIS